MIRLLQLLILGHVHEWETMQERWQHEIFVGETSKYNTVELRCKKCGDWKKKRLR